MQISEEREAVKHSRLKDYFMLMKANLSFLVVFSSLIGYYLAPGTEFQWREALILAIGGSLITVSANIINQIIERDSDKYMRRTANRPLPGGRIGVGEAWTIVFITGTLGVVGISVFFNYYAGMLGLLSLLLYGFAYTPMKKIHPIATFIGAIPGALPPLIGWVAATNALWGFENMGGWSLFLIQFFWQFPHFWAIAWLGYDDYTRAGIRMLPTTGGRKTSQAGLQAMYYCLTLIPVSMLPYSIGLSGKLSLYIVIGLGALYFVSAVLFYTRCDNASAKRLMYSSIIYLPLVLMALLFDKL
ncbi:MAG TPA: heme o synthase [Edaphocola sp.]|nr:heme o synthase [Edaphocola sp.]